MIVCHFDSGLGNQMNSYAEYLAYKKMNPTQDIYIENIVYDIKQDAISMWNGFELDRIFDVNVPNIRELFSDEQWEKIVTEVQESHFWSAGRWDFGSAIAKTLNNKGLEIENLCPQKSWNDSSVHKQLTSRAMIKQLLSKTLGSNYISLMNLRWKYTLSRQNEEIFGLIPEKGNYLCGGIGNYMYKNSGMRFVDQEVRKAFTFKPVEDQKNMELLKLVKSTNSISIHVRRGDMLAANESFFKYGYYKKAVRYIKKRVDDPYFVFFCIPGDTQWCKDNLELFDLHTESDRICFVDWNTGTESYRDMQLMAACKHNIITRTSFGWWGSYLNTYPNKITICSDFLFDTNVTL